MNNFLTDINKWNDYNVKIHESRCSKNPLQIKAKQLAKQDKTSHKLSSGQKTIGTFSYEALPAYCRQGQEPSD